jgi:hypothetical protein
MGRRFAGELPWRAWKGETASGPRVEGWYHDALRWPQNAGLRDKPLRNHSPFLVRSMRLLPLHGSKEFNSETVKLFTTMLWCPVDCSVYWQRWARAAALWIVIWKFWAMEM